jgi:hypothetical protein
LTLSRRAFLSRGALLAAAALAPLPRAAARAGLVPAGASAAADDVVLDTLNGVVAYVVPGDDRFSTAQGVSEPHPGGVAARGAEGVRVTLDGAGPGTVDAAVTVLNGFARAVDPAADTRAAAAGFSAPFAALSFARKTEVFERLTQSVDGTLQMLGGLLPAIAAFVSYSEFGVLAPGGHALTSRPVGWELSGYEGAADGRAEFHGYYGGRRRARA